MKTKKSFLLLLLVVFFLSQSSYCGATSIKTKIFFKDLKRGENFIDSQYNVLMDFVNSLTKEDVKAINEKGHDVEIYNSNALEAFKKLKTMDADQPENIKNWNYSGYNFPHNFLSDFKHMFDYRLIFREIYKIPRDDFEVALSKYSDYLVLLLDKLQDLRSKVAESGLKVYNLPRLNGIHIKQADKLLFLINDSNSNYGFKASYWKIYTKKIPQLYSNEKALTAAKLWMEFYLENDLTTYQNTDKYEEIVMAEIEKIEKRLAAISGSHNNSAESTTIEKHQNTGTKPTSTLPTKNKKFKLELPQ